MTSHNVMVVGGGLAGWVSAIHLANSGVRVQVIEKKTYPFHKFCGEYLSKEVIPYLHSLGISLNDLGANEINTFQLSSHTGKYVETSLDMGGLGIRRYLLDYQLSEIAKRIGVQLIDGSEVQKITYHQGIHTLTCKNKKTYQASLVIGAFGKRSVLDKQLKRRFSQVRSSYVGVKHYLDYDYPRGLVSLHNLKGDIVE